MRKALATDSPLLTLLNSRKSWDLPPAKRPVLTEHEQETLQAAARDWAEVDRSDPFAYARKVLHMQQGFELVSDVAHEARARRLIRRNSVMNAGEDRAWRVRP